MTNDRLIGRQLAFEVVVTHLLSKLPETERDDILKFLDGQLLETVKEHRNSDFLQGYRLATRFLRVLHESSAIKSST